MPGEWHFSWILEGRAIQDTWICPRIGLRGTGQYPAGEYGTTIRFYDSGEERIKVLWVGPILSQFCVFTVRREGGLIIQDQVVTDGAAKVSRWQFKDILESSFTWEAFDYDRDRTDWKLTQQVFARKRNTAPG